MELRHLRYFTAVVECKGYREASRQLHIAQAALSQTVSDLEDELGLELFVRREQRIYLTPAGEAFYIEAKRTLRQAEHAVSAARRAAKGKIGSLAIGFIPGATQHFLPQLIHSFKQQNPDIELSLRELTPSAQMEALAKGALDLGFTRELTQDQERVFSSRPLFHVPLVAVLPSSRLVRGEQINILDLAKDRFVLLDRGESPSLFDSILNLCHEAGFAPKFDSHAHLAESMFTLVKAEEGVSIVPAWARVFASEGIQFVRLTPNTVQVELTVAWKTASPSVVLRSFLALLGSHETRIQEATDREIVGAATP